MPPNKKGGKKFKKGKKNTSFTKALIYKDPKEDQEYAKVVRAQGAGRFELQCFDGQDRLGIIAGNMRRKVWINKDDIVLVSRWDFTTEGNKCSIIHRYGQDEVKKLQKEGEFPENTQIETESEFVDYGDDEDMMQFSYGEPSDSSSSEDDDKDDDDDDDDDGKQAVIDINDI